LQLGLSDAPDRFAEAAWGKLPAGHSIGEPTALFPRKDLAGADPGAKKPAN
jgi:hypothetical protein